MTAMNKMPTDSSKNNSQMIDCDCVMSDQNHIKSGWGFQSTGRSCRLIGRLELKKNIPLELI